MLKNLYCLIGKSGTGKTTVQNIIAGRIGAKTVSSYTTRPRRSKDETGHIFTDKRYFDRLTDLVAYTRFDGDEYGVTKKMVDEADLYVIDIPGVKELKKKYHDKKIICIGLDCSEDVLRQRMAKRGDSDEKIQERITHDRAFFNELYDVCDVVIQTDKRNARDVAQLIISHIHYFEAYE